MYVNGRISRRALWVEWSIVTHYLNDNRTQFDIIFALNR